MSKIDELIAKWEPDGELDGGKYSAHISTAQTARVDIRKLSAALKVAMEYIDEQKHEHELGDTCCPCCVRGEINAIAEGT